MPCLKLYKTLALSYITVEDSISNIELFCDNGTYWMELQMQD